MGQESKESSATMASWIGRKERNWQRRQSGRLLIFSMLMSSLSGAAHLPFLFPLFPPVFRQMNDTRKQTDPTIKKRKPTWKNTTVTYLLCNCAASPHHSATMQHHNAKLTILVKLKSQTICEKLNLTIDDPIMCLQENQFFFHFRFSNQVRNQ